MGIVSSQDGGAAMTRTCLSIVLVFLLVMSGSQAKSGEEASSGVALTQTLRQLHAGERRFWIGRPSR